MVIYVSHAHSQGVVYQRKPRLFFDRLKERRMQASITSFFKASGVARGAATVGIAREPEGDEIEMDSVENLSGNVSSAAPLAVTQKSDDYARADVSQPFKRPRMLQLAKRRESSGRSLLALNRQCSPRQASMDDALLIHKRFLPRQLHDYYCETEAMDAVAPTIKTIGSLAFDRDSRVLAASTSAKELLIFDFDAYRHITREVDSRISDRGYLETCSESILRTGQGYFPLRSEGMYIEPMAPAITWSLRSEPLRIAWNPTNDDEISLIFDAQNQILFFNVAQERPSNAFHAPSSLGIAGFSSSCVHHPSKLVIGGATKVAKTIAWDARVSMQNVVWSLANEKVDGSIVSVFQANSYTIISACSDGTVSEIDLRKPLEKTQAFSRVTSPHVSRKMALEQLRPHQLSKALHSLLPDRRRRDQWIGFGGLGNVMTLNSRKWKVRENYPGVSFDPNLVGYRPNYANTFGVVPNDSTLLVYSVRKGDERYLDIIDGDRGKQVKSIHFDRRLSAVCPVRTGDAFVYTVHHDTKIRCVGMV